MTIYHFIKLRFPWLEVPKSWEGMVQKLQRYKPTLYYRVVRWNFLEVDWVKLIMMGKVEQTQEKVCLVSASEILEGI